MINTAVSGWQIPDLEPDLEALCLRFARVAVVVVMTPNGTLPTAPPHVVDHLPAYVEEVRAVAADTSALLVDHYAEWQQAEEGSWFHWLGHGCHPNAYGHRAMARTLDARAGDLGPGIQEWAALDPVRE